MGQSFLGNSGGFDANGFSTGGFDSFSSGGSASSGFGGGFGGGDGFGSPAPSVAVPQKSRPSPAPFFLIGFILLLVATAVYFQFFVGNKSIVKQQEQGFSAPTGHALELERGRWLLTNELLVITQQGVDQGELEKLLKDMEGAVVGYFPLINQYQVKFNSQNKATLDRMKAALESQPGIVQVDYNLKLTLSGQAAGKTPFGQQGGAGKAGLMDAVAPSSAAKSFFLASPSFGSEQALKAYLTQHPGAASAMGWDFAAHGENAAVALGQGGELLFASCFFFDGNADGSVSLATTAGALRYQMACLALEGAQVIDLPLMCPPSASDALLEKEIRQWDMVFSALEAQNASFLVVKADGGTDGEMKDYLSRVLNASAVGKKHALIVGAYADMGMEVKDVTGTNLQLYDASAASPDAALCAPGANASTAATAAARHASRLFSANPPDSAEAARNQMTVQAGALAARADGSVLPALKEQAAPLPAWENLAVIQVTAADNITKLPIPGAQIKINNQTLTARMGQVKLLLAKGDFTVQAQAAGYSASRAWQSAAPTENVVLTLDKTDGVTGAVKGKASIKPSRPNEKLLLSIVNTQTGETYPDRKVPLNYQIHLYPGTYEMTFSALNCTPVTFHNVTVTAGQETQNGNVTLFLLSDLSGKAEGVIKDALTGDVLEGAQVSIYAGLDAAKEGAPVASARSAANGTYSVSLPGGAYTAYVSKEGYQDGVITVQSEGEATIQNQNCAITPVLPEGQVRVVLEWGASPSDLDSHMVNKTQGVHTYYPDRYKTAKVSGREVINLDVDDTSSYGPETTTILVQLPGAYTFYVHDYTNKDRTSSRAMADSGARVTVYFGSGSPMVFNVPDAYGTLWEVFTLENGVITPSGRMSYQSNAQRVGQ